MIPRTLLRMTAPCLVIALQVGCMSVWHGEIDRKHLLVAGTIVEAPIPAHLVVARPTVVDLDRSFRNVEDGFVDDLQSVQVRYVREKELFASCSDDVAATAYTLATRVTIDRYRPPLGFAVTLLGGFVPPLLGVAWSFPAGHGRLIGEIEWTVSDPAGYVVAKQDTRFNVLLAPPAADGFRWYTVAPDFEALLWSTANRAF